MPRGARIVQLPPIRVSDASFMPLRDAQLRSHRRRLPAVAARPPARDVRCRAARRRDLRDLSVRPTVAALRAHAAARADRRDASAAARDRFGARHPPAPAQAGAGTRDAGLGENLVRHDPRPWRSALRAVRGDVSAAARARAACPLHRLRVDARRSAGDRRGRRAAGSRRVRGRRGSRHRAPRAGARGAAEVPVRAPDVARAGRAEHPRCRASSGCCARPGRPPSSNARASISRRSCGERSCRCRKAGYNTVLDVVTSGARPVVVPFTGNGETEQRARGVRLDDVRPGGRRRRSHVHARDPRRGRGLGRHARTLGHVEFRQRRRDAQRRDRRRAPRREGARARKRSATMHQRVAASRRRARRLARGRPARRPVVARRRRLPRLARARAVARNRASRRRSRRAGRHSGDHGIESLRPIGARLRGRRSSSTAMRIATMRRQGRATGSSARTGRWMAIARRASRRAQPARASLRPALRGGARAAVEPHRSQRHRATAGSRVSRRCRRSARASPRIRDQDLCNAIRTST